jgi:ubiquinone/menaquinone biosynthesis C-methylase UbiE
LIRVNPASGGPRIVGSIALECAREKTMQWFVGVPSYPHETYWWAYVHTNAVRFFERQWLVNLILWGNFARLRDATLDELGESLPGRTLPVACVYGDFTLRLAQRVAAGGSLEVVDVLPIQLANLRRKLPAGAPVALRHCDAADLQMPDASYDRVVLFFLLHEMPQNMRRRTLKEAMRVVKPGGAVVIVDYHAPACWHPLRPPNRKENEAAIRAGWSAPSMRTCRRSGEPIFASHARRG